MKIARSVLIALILGALAVSPACAEDDTILHNFSGPPNDTGQPFSTLIQGTDGYFYGTTQPLANAGLGLGAVFKINFDGSGYEILHTFTGGDSDGVMPAPTLVQGTDGALYWTTANGGPTNGGTVFKLNTDGSGFKLLQIFDIASVDPDNIAGGIPAAGLLQASDGALCSTTTAATPAELNEGVVFKINPDGSGFSVLYQLGFTDPFVESDVLAPLIQAADGALYGLTYANLRIAPGPSREWDWSMLGAQLSRANACGQGS